MYIERKMLVQKYNNKKIYSFDKSIFVEKFTANTISSNPIELIKRAYSLKAKERVYVGNYNLEYDQFKVYTYADLYQSFLNPYLFWKRILILAAPVCIYGNVKEENHQTIVDYVIDKTISVKVTAAFGFSMCCSIAFMGILNILLNGMDLKSLLIIVLPVPLFLILFLLMRISVSERDALLIFMEDLEQ